MLLKLLNFDNVKNSFEILEKLGIKDFERTVMVKCIVKYGNMVK